MPIDQDMESNWVIYSASALFLFLSHAVLSAPVVRPALKARLGRRTFLAVHSAVSLLALAIFIWAYRIVGSGPQIFVPEDWVRVLAIAIMPVAVLFVIGRITTPAGEPVEPVPPRGIYRATRAPGAIGLILWALLHLINTGDGRRVALFATMTAIALFALIKNEWLRRGGKEPYFEETSLIPFLAMARGRQSWRQMFAELGASRLGLAVVIYFALLLLHPWVLGVDPLAGW